MSAYLIARVRVDNVEIYKEYAVRSAALIAKHGGRFLARGGASQVLEGDGIEARIVIVEFPSMEAARAYYSSTEYQQAREIRIPVSDSQFVIVQGAA